LGDFDIFSTEFDGKPFEGFTLRLFDPKTRLWTIYWADSNEGRLDGGKVGSFDGDLGEFSNVGVELARVFRAAVAVPSGLRAQRECFGRPATPGPTVRNLAPRCEHPVGGARRPGKTD
jgi:hypothetical protein